MPRTDNRHVGGLTDIKGRYVWQFQSAISQTLLRCQTHNHTDMDMDVDFDSKDTCACYPRSSSPLLCLIRHRVDLQAWKWSWTHTVTWTRTSHFKNCLLATPLLASMRVSLQSVVHVTMCVRTFRYAVSLRWFSLYIHIYIYIVDSTSGWKWPSLRSCHFQPEARETFSSLL